LPGRAVGLGIVEAFFWEHGWTEQDTAVLLRGLPIESTIDAVASRALAGTVLRGQRRVETGLIPVRFCSEIIDRLRSLVALRPKTVAWETYSAVRQRPGDDGTDTWFRTYSAEFPELLDAAVYAAYAMANDAIRTGNSLLLGYGW
jgi:hypothetical protein